MAGPYPLATLGPTITPTGITIPTYADVYASLQASFQSIYGADAYISPDSQDGQLLAVFAMGISDSNNAAVAIYNAFQPSFAQGANLSTLVRINGISRLVATNSTVTVTVVGTVGASIVNGVAEDTNGNLWNLPASVTIPGAGSIAVTATAQQQGAISAATNSVNSIYTPQLGWTSVNNPTYTAVTGAPVETDASLRVRQAQSVALPAVSPLASIAGQVAAVPGVIRSFIYENQSAVTDGNGVPSHSIDAIVEGGDLTAIAQAIQLSKSPGTGTYGGTSETVVDALSGIPITINFDVLTLTPIYVSVTVKALPGYVATTTTAIQNAVAAFLNSLPIGGEVYYSQLYSPAQLDSAGVGESYYITALTSGTAPSPVGTANIPIAFNAAAQGVVANVVVTVT